MFYCDVSPTPYKYPSSFFPQSTICFYSDWRPFTQDLWLPMLLHWRLLTVTTLKMIQCLEGFHQELSLSTDRYPIPISFPLPKDMYLILEK